MKKTINEIVDALKKYDLWIYLGKLDIDSRFRGSHFGIMWLVIQQLSFSFGAGYIWSKLFGLELKSFIPVIMLGFLIWGFITASMSEGSMTFINSFNYLRQLPLNKFIFCFRVFYSQFIYFGIGLLVSLLVLVFLNVFFIESIFFLIPGFLLLIIHSILSIILFSYLGFLYRDIPHALNMIFNFLFVLTPIIYPMEILKKKGLDFLIYINPFASLIEILRFPLINNNFAEFQHYVISLIYIISILILTLFVKKKISIVY